MQRRCTYQGTERKKNGDVEGGDDEGYAFGFSLHLRPHGEVLHVEFRPLNTRPLLHLVVGYAYIFEHGCEVVSLYGLLVQPMPQVFST